MISGRGQLHAEIPYLYVHLHPLSSALLWICVCIFLSVPLLLRYIYSLLVPPRPEGDIRCRGHHARPISPRLNVDGSSLQLKNASSLILTFIDISFILSTTTMSPSARNSADFKSPDPRSARLDAITNPGAVKINVEGAFIVDEEPRSRSRSPIEADGVHYESKDIRLPHHTGVVSHVAVDVSDDALPPPHSVMVICPPQSEIPNPSNDDEGAVTDQDTFPMLDRLADRWPNWFISRASWTLRIMAAG